MDFVSSVARLRHFPRAGALRVRPVPSRPLLPASWLGHLRRRRRLRHEWGRDVGRSPVLFGGSAGAHMTQSPRPPMFTLGSSALQLSTFIQQCNVLARSVFGTPTTDSPAVRTLRTE